MGTCYIKMSGCPNCATVDRWLSEIRTIMPEHAAAIAQFEVVDAADVRGAHPAPPVLLKDGGALLEWPFSKRALLGLLQDETRRMRNE